MSKSTIKLTTTKTAPYFPALIDGKRGRVTTKHFCNLPLHLNPNHYALLSFLVYQSNYDNTIIYSNALLLQYQKAVKDAQEVYKQGYKLFTSPPTSRGYFKWLVENGYLLSTSLNRTFLINPNLTFSKLYTEPQFYNEWVEEYQNNVNFNELADKYIAHLRGMYAKKKNKLL